MADNFIERHIEHTWETEPPRIFHRWSAISAVGASLARGFYIQHGHFRVFPNMYIKLIGDAGTRKSTAIKIMKKLLAGANYDNFAADKTRLEKFLLDLEGLTQEEDNGEPRPGSSAARAKYDAVLATNLWGDSSDNDPRECFICADEWNDFAPRGDIDFCTLLGNLWDWDDESRPYSHRLKNSKSVSIFQPTISILGGNTPDGFAKAFPPEMIGTGFLSRMILIHGERSGRKYTFPPVPNPEDTARISNELAFIRASHFGQATLTKGAELILDTIYKGWEDIDDVRFKSYSNRRFTQLLKLCLICAAAEGRKDLTAEVVVRANTYLSAAEVAMPRALGQFGKSKNSDVANKVMDMLVATHKPLSIKDLWAHVHNDLENIRALGEILQGLQVAEKVQFVQGSGWLPKRVLSKEPEFVDYSLLTEEERQGV